MRSNAEYARVSTLIAEGLNDCQIAPSTGIPRRTIRGWRSGASRRRQPIGEDVCERCGEARPDPRRLPVESYSYLLGMYLGDGDISGARTLRLRVSMDMRWPGVVLECSAAMRDVFPLNAVSVYQPDPGSNCIVASVYSKRIVCLFPQHDPGPKHERPIVLTEWQEKIVCAEPGRFLRGLIHSDGCRFTNRVWIKDKIYTYPRYNFTNASADIRALFTNACDRLGIEWRHMNARNISVARRDSVARLDEFVGPKY